MKIAMLPLLLLPLLLTNPAYAVELGNNPPSVKYYQNSHKVWPMKTARWRTNKPWPNGDQTLPTDFDSAGWPRSVPDGYQVCAGIVLRNATYPTVEGIEVLRWRISWSGKGTFTVWPNAKWALSEASAGYDGAPWGELLYSGDPVPSQGEVIVTTPSSGEAGFDLCIQSLDPDEPMREITMLPADGDFDPHGWVPAFVEEQRAYRGPIRTLGLVEGNHCPIEHWADRPLRADASWEANGEFATQGCGVPWELVIDLANETARDIWVTNHYRATDDYILQLATLFRDQLAPQQKVFDEYSNEACWGDFPVRQLVGSCLNYGVTARRHHDIMASVLGEARVVRVLAGQSCCDSPGEQAFLGYGDGSLVELYAIAPYMCGSVRYGDPPYFETPPTVDQLIESCNVGESLAAARGSCEHFQALHPGVGCAAYESGQAIVGRYPVTPDLPEWTLPMRAAQMDPRMEEIHRAYYVGLKEFMEVVEVFESTVGHWSDSHGFWSLCEFEDQLADCPKYVGVMLAIGVWPDADLNRDGSVNGADFGVFRSEFQRRH